MSETQTVAGPETERAHWWSRKPRTESRRNTDRAKRRKRAAVLAFMGFAVVLAAIESLAVRGQADFGRFDLGLSGVWQYTPAVALEAGAITWAGLALWAMLTRDRVGLPHLMTAITVMAAAGASWTGARAAHRPDVGAAYLALASVFALLMWHQIMTRVRRDDLRDSGEMQTVPARPRFGAFRWLMAPGETFSAWRLSILARVSNPDEALVKLAALKAERLAGKQAKALPALELSAEVLAKLSNRDRLALAFGSLGAIDVPSALSLLTSFGAPVDQSYAYQLVKQMGLTGEKDKPDVKTPKRRAVRTPAKKEAAK
ncbi:MAG TPA: hypothetical protein VHZ03_31810 [Trebonia sp.]|nr:hypothetical protein [Trebonia sp.]